MITAQYLDADKAIMETKEVSFKDMMKSVFDNYTNTSNPETIPHSFIKYVYKQSVILLTSVDDLVPEFNLDAFQDHPELTESLKPFYTDIDVNLYINLKKELPSFVAKNLKPLATTLGDFRKLTHFQSITFGEKDSKEIYSVDGFNCYPLTSDYEIRISASNLDSSMLAISFLPEYGSSLARHNFRNIAEITDYVLTFHNNSSTENTSYFQDFIILLSYENYPRGVNV